MAFSPEELHRMYERQNRWFAGRRNDLLRKANIARANLVLDVGCGTGVVTRDLNTRCQGCCAGVDMDSAALATVNAPRFRALAEQLPFATDSVDLVFTQLLFLWVRNLKSAVAELYRVLRPGGVLLIAAEPDYGGAIVYPDDDSVSRMMNQLAKEGADPRVARKLGPVLDNAGFTVECGVHSSHPLIAAQQQSGFSSPELIPERKRAFFFLPYFYFHAQKPMR